MRTTLYFGVFTFLTVASCSASLDEFNRCRVYAQKYCGSLTDAEDCAEVLQNLCQDEKLDSEQVNNCIGEIEKLQESAGKCITQEELLPDPVTGSSRLPSCMSLESSLQYNSEWTEWRQMSFIPCTETPSFEGTGGSFGGSQIEDPGNVIGSGGRTASPGGGGSGGIRATGGSGGGIPPGTGGAFGGAGGSYASGGAGGGGPGDPGTEVCTVAYDLEGTFLYLDDTGSSAMVNLTGDLQLAVTVAAGTTEPIQGGSVALQQLTLQNSSPAIFETSYAGGPYYTLGVFDSFSASSACGIPGVYQDGMVSWAPCSANGYDSTGPGCIASFAPSGILACDSCPIAYGEYGGFDYSAWPQFLDSLELPSITQVNLPNIVELPHRTTFSSAFTFSGYGEVISCDSGVAACL